MELAKALDVRPGVTAIIGGGGKTTLMECLAEELSAQARVIVCTTTHIYPEQNMPCLVSTSEAEIAAELARTRCVCVGSVSESGKYSAPELPFCTLCALASYVIVEADGSKRLPLKAHAPHEPVIPPEANQTILVVGASGFGRPMRESVHRAPIAAQALGVSDRAIILRHMLPNAMVAALTFLPFILCASITTLTSLDFLGFGLPLGSPSLGELLLQGKNNLQAPWLGITAFISVALLFSAKTLFRQLPLLTDTLLYWPAKNVLISERFLSSWPGI